MIELLTAATPNGRKVSIALEEMGLPYRVKAIDLKALEQKKPDFEAVNPNGRIPAIVDHDAGDFAVFESGAILVYLAEKSGSFFGESATQRSVTLQWLMWQMGGLGPMQGQANVFNRYFPIKLPEVISRYQTETARLYGVMDRRLAATDFLAGPYSIADMACYPWVAQHDWSGVALDSFPNVQRWFETVGARPAVKIGMEIPPPARKPEDIVSAARSMLAT